MQSALRVSDQFNYVSRAFNTISEKHFPSRLIEANVNILCFYLDSRQVYGGGRRLGCGLCWCGFGLSFLGGLSLLGWCLSVLLRCHFKSELSASPQIPGDNTRSGPVFRGLRTLAGRMEVYICVYFTRLWMPSRP